MFLKVGPHNISSIRFCMIFWCAQLSENAFPMDKETFSRNLEVQICFVFQISWNLVWHGSTWLGMSSHYDWTESYGLGSFLDPPDPKMAQTKSKFIQTTKVYNSAHNHAVAAWLVCFLFLSVQNPRRVTDSMDGMPAGSWFQDPVCVYVECPDAILKTK